MKKIVFVSKYNACLCDEADRLPNNDEVRVQLKYTALSAGTERALITANEGGDDTCKFSFPSWSGYSGSGIITHVGSLVTEFKVGDRVMVHGGNHQQFCTVNKKEVVTIPDGVDLKQAAFTIIAGFSLAAVRKAKVELGHNVLVCGLGLLGLFSTQYLKLCGALNVIVSDLNPARRELALNLGADYAFNPSDKDYIEKVKAVTGGKGVDSVIEVTGNAAAMTDCLKCTKKFGKVVLLGCTRKLTEIDFYNDVHRPGIEIIGAHSGARPALESFPGFWTEMDDCRVTLNYIKKGVLNFEGIISETHSPNDAHSVYKRLCENTLPVGVVFDWDKL